MNFFKTNRIIIWTLTALLVVALSALGTMIYHLHCDRARNSVMKECGMKCDLLSEELGLSEAQAKNVDRIRADYLHAAGPTADSLRISRSELVTELGREAADTLRLNQLAQRIGSLQTRLTLQTIDQYLGIRKECTREQQEKLSSFYYELMGCCPAGEGGKMREQCRQR
jgi:Spy/CpxP family protein refolding chaperone